MILLISHDIYTRFNRNCQIVNNFQDHMRWYRLLELKRNFINNEYESLEVFKNIKMI
jgi:hypothetical protein